MEITAYDLAQRYVGEKEVFGAAKSNPVILAMLQRDQQWPQDDGVPWCGAFINHIAWLLRLPRSKDLRARSWLRVGEVVQLCDAVPGDVVILSRGAGEQPGADVIDAPGHVGFYAGKDERSVFMLGGNQGDEVNVSPFALSRVLGVRRLG